MKSGQLSYSVPSRPPVQAPSLPGQACFPLSLSPAVGGSTLLPGSSTVIVNVANLQQYSEGGSLFPQTDRSLL